MQIFVTGGTGFIGSHLIKHLLDQGHQVRALARDEAKAHRLGLLGVDTVIGDVRDRDSLRGALSGSQLLFHIGNVSRWWLKDKRDFYRINVEGTKNVMEEAMRDGVERVVYMSSLAAIRQPRGVLSREDLERRHDFESHYARSKYLAEKEVLRMHRQEGLQAVILNPGVVIGPCDLKTFGRMIIDFANRRLAWLPFPETIVPLVYVDDVVEAALAAADRGRVGERYIIVGHNVSIRGAFEILEELTGIPAPKKTLPPMVVRLIAYFMEVKAFFTKRPPKLPIDAVRAMEIGAIGSNDKAVRELGIEFTPLSVAFEKALSWYREKGFIGSG